MTSFPDDNINGAAVRQDAGFDHSRDLLAMDLIDEFTGRLTGGRGECEDDKQPYRSHRGGAGLQAPLATWAYLVNDDPFRDRMTAMLTGPGGATLAIYSAAIHAAVAVMGTRRESAQAIRRRANPFGD